MPVRPCLILLLALVVAFPRLGLATSAENGMFTSATAKLRAQLYEQAERDFAQFVQQFPESPRLPEAILAQAEARFKLANYNGALELLTSRQSQAGKWADEFLFWIGECYSHKGDQAKAADTFSTLVKAFPHSSRLLEAIVKAAAARSNLQPPDWPQVLQSLQDTNGVFQSAARTNGSSDWVVRGYLLLGEGFLAQSNYHAAEAVLTPFGNRLMSPEVAWQRQYVMCRAQLGDGRAEAALLSTSNLLMHARSTEQPSLVAQSISFKARALEQAGRLDQAIATYKENLTPTVSAQYQQQALLKITDLSTARNNIPDATQTLEKFLTTYTNAPTADLGWLTLGELRLLQFANSANGTPASSSTNAISPTNFLEQARQAFDTLTNRFPRSQYFGLGSVDLGWCFFLQNKLAESERAFQTGVEHLPRSPNLARAYFKLGDSQFRQKKFAAAAVNYDAVVEKFRAFPEIQTNLFEPALYQSVQAALSAGNLPAATNAMQKILEWYPDSFRTERAVLLTGQEIGRAGNPAQARVMFSDFAAKITNSVLLAEVKLAIARTYEQENDWTNAIQQYDLWLASFTNDPARPRAEFCRSLDYARVGNETNAWMAFTNFVAVYPTNELAPQAQWWLADFKFRAGDYNGAEGDFQTLVKNWPASDLACEARMMAGQAAVARQRWEDAKDYFLSLYNNTTNCPTEIRLRAFIAYGDYWTIRESTNKPVSDFLKAAEIFGKVSQENPTNEIGLLALGRKGDALLQAGQFDEAAKAYQQLTNAPGADFATRAQGIIGLGIVLEKQADQKSGAEKTDLLRQALDYYLEVLFPEKLLRDGEKADPHWTANAGDRAIRLAEALQDWPHVITIARELCDKMPELCPSLEKKIAKARENLRAGG